MDKRKTTKRQWSTKERLQKDNSPQKKDYKKTIVHKRLHIKLNIKQHRFH